MTVKLPIPKCPNCRLLYRLLKRALEQTDDRRFIEEVEKALEQLG